MIKVAFCGGPGSGKTSLARQLTTELYNNRQINAQHVTEFARDYINDIKRHEGSYEPNMADQYLFYSKQLQRENIIPKEVDYLITDSPIFLPAVFAGYMCDLVQYHERQQYWYFLEEILGKITFHYNYIFYLPRQKPFLNDGTRNETAEQSDDIAERTKAFLKLCNIHYSTIESVDDESRVKEVLRYLGIE